MCLDVNIKIHNPLCLKQPFIAQEDFWVYKILERDKGSSKWYTPYRKMDIEFGKVYEVEDMVANNNGEVNEGLHAFFKRKACWHSSSFERVFVAVVPKGSKYYVGAGGELVSDHLMILKKKHVFPWEKKHLFQNTLTAKAYGLSHD